MSVLSHENHIVQNPALGAVLLWRFAVGYTGVHKTRESPVLQLAFIVLPMIYHQETCQLLSGTQRQSGLHGFVDKFSRTEVVKSDLLLAIHSRAIAFRSLTLDSLRIGVRHRLLALLTSMGQIVPLTTSAPSAVPNSARHLLAAAEKLGAWCAPLTLFEITSALKGSV
jgi:hypothetical protein